MNEQQLIDLRAKIFLNPTATALVAAGNTSGLRSLLNALAAPAFKVWRKNVQRAEIYHQVSAEGTSWSWTTYKAQSVAEQNSWTQMFMGDEADFSLPNLRLGVENIFGVNNAQTTHVKAIAKRDATVAEKMLAVGTGSLAVPAVLVIQGEVSEVETAKLVFKDDGTIWTAQG